MNLPPSPSRLIRYLAIKALLSSLLNGHVICTACFGFEVVNRNGCSRLRCAWLGMGSSDIKEETGKEGKGLGIGLP